MGPFSPFSLCTQCDQLYQNEMDNVVSPQPFDYANENVSPHHLTGHLCAHWLIPFPSPAHFDEMDNALDLIGHQLILGMPPTQSNV